MRIVNSSFQECQDADQSFQNLSNQVIDYLKNQMNDEQLLCQIMENSHHSFIQLTDGETYSIMAHDGSIRNLKYRDSAGAFKTNMSISVNDEEIFIIPGIALRPNFNKHQFIHEYLHVISSNQHNFFDSDGIAYTKTGTKIDYYDKKLNDYSNPNNPSSDGLNEGMTEFLTSQITGEYTGNYPGYVAIAKLLSSSNDLLLKSYFSSDPKTLENFYADLEEKQSIISREDLCKLDSHSLDDDQLMKIIVGAIEYNKAYHHDVDLHEISDYLDQYYMQDSGSWYDSIQSSIRKYEENIDYDSISK